MPARLSCRLLLRAALHLLLVTGLVAGPALAAASELHGIEHAALAAESDGHGHGHEHSADGDPHHGGPHHGGSADPDHATGAHGLVHQLGSLPVAMPCDGIFVSTPPLCEQRVPEFRHCHLPGNPPSLPFRPPIA